MESGKTKSMMLNILYVLRYCAALTFEVTLLHDLHLAEVSERSLIPGRGAPNWGGWCQSQASRNFKAWVAFTRKNHVQITLCGFGC